MPAAQIPDSFACKRPHPPTKAVLITTSKPAYRPRLWLGRSSPGRCTRPYLPTSCGLSPFPVVSHARTMSHRRQAAWCSAPFQHETWARDEPSLVPRYVSTTTTTGIAQPWLRFEVGESMISPHVSSTPTAPEFWVGIDGLKSCLVPEDSPRRKRRDFVRNSNGVKGRSRQKGSGTGKPSHASLGSFSYARGAKGSAASWRITQDYKKARMCCQEDFLSY
jgi:hypothetical protein